MLKSPFLKTLLQSLLNIPLFLLDSLIAFFPKLILICSCSCETSQTPSHLSLSHVVTGRIRLNSESHASTVSRDEELQARGEDEAGTPTDGAPFRGRSKSAPPALWAAKKYGRQLRRMSDEFDSLLDKGVSMRMDIKGVKKAEIKGCVVVLNW